MTLEELQRKVPEAWKPIVAEYGPALLSMSAQELWDWVELLVNGRDDDAYATILRKLDNSEILTEWIKARDDWQEANKTNKARHDLQKRAMLAVLQVLLGIALTLVGL